MALIVETGLIVPNANSYANRADYIAYAGLLGVVIPDEDEADVEMIRAAQFIDSHEWRLKGQMVDRSQPMAFPRSGLYIDGFSWDEDEIPRQVIHCQFKVAMDIHAGVDPYNPPPNPNRPTRRERVEGAVEVEYFGDDKMARLSVNSTWQALLSSLMVSSGLRMVRA